MSAETRSSSPRCDEFAEGGYSGTSTESIARAVGVSQPYLFQLFGTKRELFLAVVRHGFQRTRAGLPRGGQARPPKTTRRARSST